MSFHIYTALEASVNATNVKLVSRTKGIRFDSPSDTFQERLMVKIRGRYTSRFLIHCFGRVVIARLIRLACTEVPEVALFVPVFISSGSHLNALAQGICERMCHILLLLLVFGESRLRINGASVSRQGILLEEGVCAKLQVHGLYQRIGYSLSVQ